jgi:hypothetical protein
MTAMSVQMGKKAFTWINSVCLIIEQLSGFGSDLQLKHIRQNLP